MLKSQVERLKFIRNIDIIVGIDIAKETHWVRIISPYGLEFCKPFPINNNIIDFKLLEDKIKNIMCKNNLFFEVLLALLKFTLHLYFVNKIRRLYEKRK